MKAYQIAILLTFAICGYFWMAWISEIQSYRCNNEILTAMLTERGMTDIRLYPKSHECRSFNAARGYRIVSGEVCVGDN